MMNETVCKTKAVKSIKTNLVHFADVFIDMDDFIETFCHIADDKKFVILDEIPKHSPVCKTCMKIQKKIDNFTY